MRTGFDLFTSVGEGGYVAEKAESQTGWLFPVGDEVGGLGYRDMFTDMFNALDRRAQPRETFYDGYVVNAIMDAAYKSVETKKWEPVELAVWRGQMKRVPGRMDRLRCRALSHQGGKDARWSHESDFEEQSHRHHLAEDRRSKMTTAHACTRTRA